jgi:integrase
MSKKTEYTLEAVNDRLAQSRVKCKIMQRGEMLWAQATFPPKPGINRPRPYQQRISLGVPASDAGFRQAEKEARIIGAELAGKAFRWEKYIDPQRLPENRPVAQWTEEFKRWQMETNSLSAKTWGNGYEPIFSRLPQDAPLTNDVLMALVRSIGADTRMRLEVCRVLQKLADFAKVDADLLKFKGNYGPSKVADRDLPTDEAIAEWWHHIPNARWQWAYGVMAAYGLRDHEVFFCEWTSQGLQVLGGKTGPRLVHQPLYPEWAEAWDLQNIKLPRVENVEAVYDDGRLGQRFAKQFRRYKVPFPPYDLRHCYGIRASVTFEFPVTTAADLMGHSPDVHLKRYHKHIKLKQNQDATQRVMQRPDLPQAPMFKPPAALPDLV